MEYQSVFQAETQAKIVSIELPPSSVRRRITLNYCTVIGKNFATPQTRTIVKILMWQLFQWIVSNITSLRPKWTFCYSASFEILFRNPQRMPRNRSFWVFPDSFLPWFTFPPRNSPMKDILSPPAFSFSWPMQSRMLCWSPVLPHFDIRPVHLIKMLRSSLRCPIAVREWVK